MIIGITGEIGSGKSTAAQLFGEHGFIVLDSDQIVHQLLIEDSEIISAVQKRFGKGVLDNNGQIDRKQLANLVFKNPEALEFLENLLHPKVRDHWLNIRQQDNGKNYIVEVPLLFEKNYQSDFDKTICVIADRETTLNRLRDKGWSEGEIKDRLRRFLPIEEKMQKSDFVLLNNSSRDVLREEVKYCVNELNRK